MLFNAFNQIHFFKFSNNYHSSVFQKDSNMAVRTKDYYITGRANPIFCAVGLRLIPI